MICIDVYDNVLQFPPKSSNFAVIEEEGDNIPQATINIWITLCEGDVSCCMRQMVVKPNLTGFMIHASTFFGRYL
jgi:hypothetical protein